MICDEVLSGAGRVGASFWAISNYSIRPDAIVFGKPLCLGGILYSRAATSPDSLFRAPSVEDLSATTYAALHTAAEMGIEVAKHASALTLHETCISDPLCIPAELFDATVRDELHKVLKNDEFGGSLCLWHVRFPSTPGYK